MSERDGGLVSESGLFISASLCLLRRTLDSPGVGFDQKLHMVYLINDVIHHW